MDPSVFVSLIAVLASTVTAVVSVLATTKTQRVVAREQFLWQARSDTYVRLQMWIEEIYAWHDKVWLDGSTEHELPPELPTEVQARIRVLMSEDVNRTFSA